MTFRASPSKKSKFEDPKDTGFGAVPPQNDIIDRLLLNQLPPQHGPNMSFWGELMNKVGMRGMPPRGGSHNYGYAPDKPWAEEPWAWNDSPMYLQEDGQTPWRGRYQGQEEYGLFQKDKKEWRDQNTAPHSQQNNNVNSDIDITKLLQLLSSFGAASA